MIDSGQPTHAFDLDKLCSSKKKKKIIIRRAKNGESISALDGKTYNLDPDILVIADEEKPIAIAGIKGGVSTAISPDTKIVFLEYAIFNPQLIYQASKKLSLTSDASLRFSHGVLDESTKRGVNLFKKLASKYNIAYPSRFEVQKGDNNSKSIKTIRVDKNYFDQRLGINLSDKKISSIIKSIGCKVKQDKQKFIITTPPFRQDLQIKEDIVEEVGRIYGFNLLPYDFLDGNISPIQDDSNFLQENKIREILLFNSFDEVFTTSFLSQEQINYFNQKDQESLKVKNFLSLKYQFLRPSLLPGLLNIIAKNDDNFSTIKIFEIGKVFFPEKKSLAIASMGATKIKEVLSEFTDFYLVKKIINQIGQAFKIGDFEINQVPTSQNNFYLKAFEIKLNQKVIGLIGYINQSILSRLNIKKAVAFSEIDLDLVFKAKPQGVSFKNFTDFPKIIRDISFFAPQDLLYKDIEKTIKSVKIDFLEDFYLIDTYQAQKNGPLSLTLRFVFRHNKRTLKDEEANNQKEKIEKLLVEKFKVTIR
jgi:phenylalanyl-tRNA synthetase beta chain